MEKERISVLLVDDEQSIRELTAKFLQEEARFNVATAANHADAMRLVEEREGPFDVALIDRMLTPGPDGIQVMRDIKARYPQTECIMATGWGIEDRQEALLHGALGYLAKPFDEEELALLIRAAAQQVRLRAINRKVFSSRELDSVLRNIATAVRSLAGADEAEILLPDEASGALRAYGRALLPPLDGPHPLAGLTRRVISSGKTEAVNIPQGADGLGGLGPAAAVCVPIPGHNESLGAICAYSGEPERINRGAEINTMQTLADQAGLAISNARAFEETNAYAAYMAALVKTSGQLTQTTNQDEQLRLAWDFVRDQLNTPTFVVALRHEQAGVITFPMYFDKGQAQTADPLALAGAEKKSILAHVISTGEPFYAPSGTAREEQCAQQGITPITQGDPCQTCLYIPLQASGHVFGAISIQAYQPHAFPPTLQQAFHALANQLAIALNNADLVTSTARQAQKLQTMLGLSRDVASTLALPDVLERACQGAVEFFGADHSGLLRPDADEAFGTVVAAYPPGRGAAGRQIPLRGVPAEERLFNRREPLVINRVADRADLGPVREILLHELNIHSTMIVPVIARERLLGSLSIDAVGRERHFMAEELELAQAFAAQVAVAIDHADLYTQAEKRRQLLDALDQAARHIRAEKDPQRLMHDIVRLATELAGCGCGCLLTYERQQENLAIRVTHQMPPELTGRRLKPDKGLVGEALRMGKTCARPAYATAGERCALFDGLGLHYATAVPLHAGEGVAAVLFLADTRPGFALEAAVLETLDRFAGTAAIALSISRMLTAEQRAIQQQKTLHRISDYIQESQDDEKIMQMIMTGITAGYGVGFNRAALFRREGEKELLGRIGIGHFDKAAQQKAWAQDDERQQDNFERYCRRLEAGELKATPLDTAVRGLRLPAGGDTVFDRVLQERQYRIVQKAEAATLPPAFVRAFRPAFPLLVVATIARGAATGLLVVDNKFTEEPISEELIQSLLTYVNTAAIAVDNRRLLEEVQQKLGQVGQSRAAAGMVAEAILRPGLEQTLEEIAGHTRGVLDADAVTLYACDAEAERLVAWGYSHPTQRRPSAQREPARLTSTAATPYQILRLAQEPYFELVEDGNFAGSPLAGQFVEQEEMAAGIGIQLRADEKKMGVLFVNYRRPHHFGDEELSTIKMFAYLAAAAIQLRRLYDEARRHANVLEELYQAGQAISGSLDVQKTLDQVAIQAVRLVSEGDGDGCTCHIALKSANRLRFEAASPPEVMAALRERMPVIDMAPGGKGGIVGRVARTGEPALLRDVAHDSDYLSFHADTRAELAVPLKHGERVIGVINLEHAEAGAFGADELHHLESLAALAATAVEAARLYEQVTLVSEIGRNTNSLELGPFLESLFSRLESRFGQQDIAVYTNLGLTNDKKRALEVTATRYYPMAEETVYLPLEGPGIMAHVARTGQAHYAPAVAEDALYVSLLPAIRSEYALPLIFGGDLLGVLNLESPAADAFSREDRELLDMIADQVAVALHNVRQYDRLRQAQGEVGVRTTMAWIGMVGTYFRHQTRNELQAIIEGAQGLRGDLEVATPAEIVATLDEIELLGKRVQQLPLPPPLSADEGVESIALAEAIHTRVAHLKTRLMYQNVTFTVDCASAEECTVRAGAEWLKLLIDLLASNAAQAMAETPEKLLNMRVRRAGERLVVDVQDTGKGLTPQEIDMIFKQAMPSEHGSGVGLLVAQLIVLCYGGEIDVDSTEGSGTTIQFWLPVEQPREPQSGDE